MVRQSGRLQKVADQIQRELSEVLRRELRDPRVGMITLTDVRLSPDCAHATVYYTCLEHAHANEAAAGLRRASGFLRSQLAKRLDLYSVPQLRFVYDESIERGDRLTRLIDSLGREDKH
jgi:ribosome-binding factor A